MDRPFSDSLVTFQSKTGKKLGPYRVSVFMDDSDKNLPPRLAQPIVVLTDTAKNKGKSVSNAMEEIAGFVCNHLYRGLFPDPEKIIWVERQDPKMLPEGFNRGFLLEVVSLKTERQSVAHRIPTHNRGFLLEIVSLKTERQSVAHRLPTHEYVFSEPSWSPVRTQSGISNLCLNLEELEESGKVFLKKEADTER